MGDEQTTGSVKSGARPDWDIEVVTEFVRVLEVPGVGGAITYEYTTQTAITSMSGIAIFSALLSPCFFLATASFPKSLVLLFLDDKDSYPIDYDAVMADA